MGTRKQKILVALAICAAGAVLLAAGYAWLAFSPTGYRAVETDVAAARKRLSEKARPRETPAAAAGAVDEAPEQYDILPNGKPGPRHRLNFFEEIEAFNGYEQHFMMFQNTRSDGTPIEMRFLQLGPQGFVFNLFNLPRETVTGKELWAGLAPQKKKDYLRMIRTAFGNRFETPNPTALQVDSFHRELDRVEGFLLRPRWDIPETSSVLMRYGGSSFDRLALLAIARASLWGEQRRAAELLDRYLAAVRVLRMKDDAGHFRLDVVMHVFFGLAELPEVPEEAWEKARRSLEAMRLSDADKGDLLRLLGVRFYREVAANLNQLGTVNNTWHYLFRGKAESVTNMALRPIALREAEKVALALSSGDAEAIRQERAGWASVMELMNARQVDSYINDCLTQINRVENMNAQVDRALLYWQIARAWREKKELAPVVTQGAEQLERVDLERFGAFTVHPYDDFGNPRQDELKPLSDAIRKFQSKGEVATRPEDIEAVIKAAGPGEWWKYVTLVDARPVYLIWGTRRMQPSELNWRAGGREIAEDTIEIVEIYAVANHGPVVRDWMRKILKEKRSSNSKEERKPEWRRGEQLLL